VWAACTLRTAKRLPPKLGRKFLFPWRWRRRGRCRDRNRLAGLQFTAVFNVIGLLQFVHGHLVHFCNGGERLSACNDVRVTCRCRMRRRHRWSGCIRGRWRSLSDHYAWPDVRDLLLQLQDFLGKRINFGVLFVDFFCQRFDLSGISWFCRLRRGRLRKRSAKRRNQDRTKNTCELHRVEKLATGIFVWQGLRRVEPLNSWSVESEIRHNANPFNASTFQRREGRGLLSNILLLDFFMPERIQKPIEPAPWGPKQGDGGGPRSPDISRPDTKDLLKKMRKVDPNQSKRYRQRTGQ